MIIFKLIIAIFHAWILFVTLFTQSASAQEMIIDDFHDLNKWTTLGSTGTQIRISKTNAQSGSAIRIDYDLQSGGYVLVRKAVKLQLPENFAFLFNLHGEGKPNNFEFKLLDASGKNVWWRNQQEFTFPSTWEEYTVQKRHLQLAWGESDAPLSEVAYIEIAIAAGQGGQGSLTIDSLRFEERGDSNEGRLLMPIITSSSHAPDFPPENIVQEDLNTLWKSLPNQESQWIMLDFQKRREYGGLSIDWDEQDFPLSFNIEKSDNLLDWKTIYTAEPTTNQRSYIYLPDSDSRYLRINLLKSSRAQGYGIRNLLVKSHEFSASTNKFFASIAKDYPRGLYPKYFHDEQTYWTLLGTYRGHKEGLINEEGVVEVDKGGFSIEPFLFNDGQLITWNEVTAIQGLENGYLPIPSIVWTKSNLALTITAFAAEESIDVLYIRYRIENLGTKPENLKLFLAIRPFQVNPPWQSLNMQGGISKIHEIDFSEDTFMVNQNQSIIALTPPEDFGAVSFDNGSITQYLEQGLLPTTKKIKDQRGFASAAMEYRLELSGGANQEYYLAVPLNGKKLTRTSFPPGMQVNDYVRQKLHKTIARWETELDQIEFDLPPSAEKLTDTLKSTLAYIFINRDDDAIQPGSRTYGRSWIRDGALTSLALLQMGYQQPVRKFLEWYASYQNENGSIPCCVDKRGADRVPEHDSHGEFVFAIKQYYNFTHDVGFLRLMWPKIVKAVSYIEQLRDQRRTEEYLQPENLQFYGLVPESISHEGYAAKPVHSYWDDFFVLRGLKDAASIAEILGDDQRMLNYRKLRDEFHRDLFASISKTIARHDIDYVPGSAELGDFDPNSTGIAIDPIDEMHSLPQRELQNTFASYLAYFRKRRANEISWDAYTPYELRLVGIFNHLGLTEEAHEILDYLIKDQRPAGWNQWAEVVWREPTVSQFIGDMPHTWVGSEFIRSFRSLFVFERELDRSLVIASGIPLNWLTSKEGVTVKRLPTHYGSLNYHIHNIAPGELQLKLSGSLVLPPGKIIVKTPLKGQSKEILVNGIPQTNVELSSIIIEKFPAEITIRY